MLPRFRAVQIQNRQFQGAAFDTDVRLTIEKQLTDAGRCVRRPGVVWALSCLDGYCTKIVAVPLLSTPSMVITTGCLPLRVCGLS